MQKSSRIFKNNSNSGDALAMFPELSNGVDKVESKKRQVKRHLLLKRTLLSTSGSTKGAKLVYFLQQLTVSTFITCCGSFRAGFASNVVGLP
jgi:hypothetical protein